MQNDRNILYMNSLKLGNIGSLVSFDSESSKMTSKEVEIIIENDKIIEIGNKLGNADSFIDCGKFSNAWLC